LRQQRILNDVWPALKQGGVLVYSTCTYNDDENLNNLQLLQRECDFESVPIAFDPSWGIELIQSGNLIGYQCYPHKVNGEGFFMSVARKRGPHQNFSFRSKGFQRPPKQIIEEIKNWILPTAEQNFLLDNNSVVAFSKEWERELDLFRQYLRVALFGTDLATIKHNRIVPSHALAMSVNINRQQFECYAVDKTEAIKFLRKDNLQIQTEFVGYALVLYEGHPLGWVNILDSRVNNFYPKEWRIRLDPNIK
jgi:NOL1/NOP2/fmu family ribosome biogenesis protein